MLPGASCTYRHGWNGLFYQFHVRVVFFINFVGQVVLLTQIRFVRLCSRCQKKKRLCSDASIPPSLSRLPFPNLHPCLVFCNFHSHCFDPEMMMKPETGDAAAVVVAQASWPCSRRRTCTQQRCAACRKAAAAAASAAAPPKKWSVKEHHDAFSR